jgi:hypothetical protein
MRGVVLPRPQVAINPIWMENDFYARRQYVLDIGLMILWAFDLTAVPPSAPVSVYYLGTIPTNILPKFTVDFHNHIFYFSDGAQTIYALDIASRRVTATDLSAFLSGHIIDFAVSAATTPDGYVILWVSDAGGQFSWFSTPGMVLTAAFAPPGGPATDLATSVQIPSIAFTPVGTMGFDYVGTYPEPYVFETPPVVQLGITTDGYSGYGVSLVNDINGTGNIQVSIWYGGGGGAFPWSEQATQTWPGTGVVGRPVAPYFGIVEPVAMDTLGVIWRLDFPGPINALATLPEPCIQLSAPSDPTFGNLHPILALAPGNNGIYGMDQGTFAVQLWFSYGEVKIEASLAGEASLSAFAIVPDQPQPMILRGYGNEAYGSSPYGSGVTFGVEGAVALNANHVEVTFTSAVDFSYGPVLENTNYEITPTLNVLSVVEGPGNSVILNTSPHQAGIFYVVVVSAAQSLIGTPLDPAQNAAQFAGFPIVPSFFAVATSVQRVRVVFAQVMLNDLNLSSPSSYSVSDFDGNSLPIETAVPEQATNPLSVMLTLGTNLGDSDFYVCAISNNIRTEIGQNVVPPTSVFQWLQGETQINVPLSVFTGEVSNDPLLGDPGGLVFFSPALDTSTPNSIIQVEDVDVCTTAYDTYTLPAPVDPIPLYTYGGGLVPTPSPDPYLLNQCVLWAPFPRLVEAQFEVGFNPEDIVPPPVDTSCSILINMPWAPGYVALLNDPVYYLLPQASPPQSVPPMFITANNLAPIPPGPETIIVLHVQLGGRSNFPPSTATMQGGLDAGMDGSSKLLAAPGPPPVVLASASMSASATAGVTARVRLSGTARFSGLATVRAFATGSNNFPTVLQGSSVLSLGVTLHASVGASIGGDSGCSTSARVRWGVGASPVGLGTAAGTLRARWATNAQVAGAGTFTATATVTHKDNAFLHGNATVTAAPT